MRRRETIAGTARRTSAICTRRSKRGDFPQWTFACRSCPRTRPRSTLQPVRPHQGVAAQGLSADRGRRPGAEPQSGQLLRRGRAGRLLAVQRRAGHRLLAGQDAAGPHLLLCRRAPLSPGRELRAAAGEPAALPRPHLPRDGAMRFDGTAARTPTTSRTASAARQDKRAYREPPLQTPAMPTATITAPAMTITARPAISSA